MTKKFEETFSSSENALKFVYSKVEFKKIAGGNTPGLPLRRRGRGRVATV